MSPVFRSVSLTDNKDVTLSQTLTLGKVLNLISIFYFLNPGWGARSKNDVENLGRGGGGGLYNCVENLGEGDMVTLKIGGEGGMILMKICGVGVMITLKIWVGGGA